MIPLASRIIIHNDANKRRCATRLLSSTPTPGEGRERLPLRRERCAASLMLTPFPEEHALRSTCLFFTAVQQIARRHTQMLRLFFFLTEHAHKHHAKCRTLKP